MKRTQAQEPLLPFEQVRAELHQRFGGGQLDSLAFIDLNLVAQINRLIGKTGMDLLFRHVEGCLSRAARRLGGATIAWRRGGDEFMLAASTRQLGTRRFRRELKSLQQEIEGQWFAVVSLGPEERVAPEAREQIRDLGGELSPVAGIAILVAPMSESAAPIVAAREFIARFAGTLPEPDQCRIHPNERLDERAIGNRIHVTLSVGVSIRGA